MQDVKGKPNQRSKNLLFSSGLTFLLLGLFILAAFLVELLVHPVLSSGLLLVTGLVMSLVPALVWLAFFYRQDRKEPEPKGMVLQVFILGGLLAAAIGIPLVENVFSVSDWLSESLWVNILGAILVIGFTQEYLKFSAVRFSVYYSQEFDETTDGIIYATAAGLGYASVLNLAFIINTGGVNLGIAAVRVVLVALAQASIAGVMGYFLGRSRMEKRPLWWLPAGMALSAGLNGLFFTLWGNLSRATIKSTGGFVNPWVGLVLAVGLALAVVIVLAYLIRRNQRALPAGNEE